ncbi:zinc finger protein 782-like [Phymastichus coffea]|uniref:zinc finger protein 782-like n=1 Tax=Phymastichus coffea TaxID=108790 RepID=UPI00273B532C|nr:zinc finger protein 782-like [Phymastichus coffea]
MTVTSVSVADGRTNLKEHCDDMKIKNVDKRQNQQRRQDEFIFTTVFLPPPDLDNPGKVKKDLKYSCEQCGYASTSKYHIERHVKARHLTEYSLKNANDPPPEVKRIFKCENCDRSYSHASSLRTHRRYDCGKFPQFHCSQCNYVTKHKCDLNKHTRTRHPDADGPTAPMYICVKCGNTYKHRDSLYHHAQMLKSTKSIHQQSTREFYENKDRAYLINKNMRESILKIRRSHLKIP